MSVLNYDAPEEVTTGMVLELLRIDADGQPLTPFRSSRFRVAAGCRTPPDQHAVTEMWIIAEGSGRLQVDDRELDVRRHDVVRFSPFSRHEIENTGSADLVIFSFWW